MAGSATPTGDLLSMQMALATVDEDAQRLQLKGLGMAYRLFRAPFPPAVIGTDEVKLAALRPADAEAVPEEEAHAGVFIQCWMEEVGFGGIAPGGVAFTEVQIWYARVFAIAGVLDFRTCETLRSKVPMGGLDTSDADGPVVIVRCAGGKAPRVVDIKPFDAACPGNGMTPFMEDWFLSCLCCLCNKLARH